MSGFTLSLTTYAVTIVIGFGIASIIWALPRILDKIMPEEKKED